MASYRLRAAIAATALFAISHAAPAQTIPLTPNLLQHVQGLAATAPGGAVPVAAGGCVLVNNVWNPAQTPAGFAQSVFLERNTDVLQPGWRWSAPGSGTEALSMPEIVCGDKPWDAPRGMRPDFPFRVLDKTPVVSFDVDLKAQGTYNLTFSLWAVSALPAVKDKISLEIVVWNVAGGLKIDGEKIGTITAGGTTYDIWLEKKHGVITGPDPFTWPLVQFVAREPKLRGILDFGPLLDELVNRGLLKRSHYLTSVEMGTEIAAGSGELHLKTFDVGLR